MIHPSILAEFAISTGMVVYTVVVHALGLLALSRVLRLELREERALEIDPYSLRALAFTVALVLGLFVIHGVEIWSYAFLYLALDALPHLREAVYFSTITYGTVGYSDALMAEQWRLVSAIEGINGVILLGWSTAFFVTMMTRLLRR